MHNEIQSLNQNLADAENSYSDLKANSEESQAMSRDQVNCHIFSRLTVFSKLTSVFIKRSSNLVQK